jgi:hypothetical protein
LDGILRKALERDPDNRYQSIPDFMSACRAFLAEGWDIRALPGKTSAKVGKHTLLLWILGFSALAVLIVTYILHKLLSN